ncbi:MAG: hypothetical protein JSR09_00220 [Bacteroidetes bacterium]|nr:hypothetical protein [Bacteroidota bacterium]MBS1648108.1 hypothetical protein [Bacteroidota bacterium]
MRLLKHGLLSILILFILLTAIGSLFPSDIIVSRAVNISANKDSVETFISNYNKWNLWMEGAKQSEFKVVAQDSTKAFFGTTTIQLQSVINNIWKHEWKGRNTIQYSTIQLIQKNNITIVQWQFEQHVKWYFWQKFGTMLNDKILGTTMEQSLDNLKKLVETK